MTDRNVPVDAALRNLGVPDHRVDEVSERVRESEAKEERIRERIEQHRQRRELYTCSECGTLADLRLEIHGDVSDILNVQKEWITAHYNLDGGSDVLYFHFDEDEVERGRGAQQLADDIEELVDSEPPAPEPEPREYPEQPGPEGGDPMTDGGQPEDADPDGVHFKWEIRDHDSAILFRHTRTQKRPVLSITHGHTKRLYSQDPEWRPEGEDIRPPDVKPVRDVFLAALKGSFVRGPSPYDPEDLRALTRPLTWYEEQAVETLRYQRRPNGYRRGDADSPPLPNEAWDLISHARSETGGLKEWIERATDPEHDDDQETLTDGGVPEDYIEPEDGAVILDTGNDDVLDPERAQRIAAELLEAAHVARSPDREDPEDINHAVERLNWDAETINRKSPELLDAPREMMFSSRPVLPFTRHENRLMELLEDIGMALTSTKEARELMELESGERYPTGRGIETPLADVSAVAPGHREDLTAALDTFGDDIQYDLAVEETGELIAELAGFVSEIPRYLRYRTDGDDLARELADCQIMLEQLALMIGEDKVETEKSRKMDRLRGRIADAREDGHD